MNIGRSEFTRLVRVEVKYNKIIELSNWVDDCLEMLAIVTNGTNIVRLNDAIETLDEAYNEFWAYITEIKS